jgi:hypothetical protein
VCRRPEPTLFITPASAAGVLPLEPTQSANFAPANQQMIVRISISSNMFSERRRRVVLAPGSGLQRLHLVLGRLRIL